MDSIKSSFYDSTFPSSISSVANLCGVSPNPLGSLHFAGSSSASSLNSLKSQSPSLTSESSSLSEQRSMDHGRPFVEMLKENEHYGKMFKVETQYKVKLMHGRVHNLHWFVMVKMVGANLPYLTFEITTSDMTDLQPTTRNIVKKEGCWAGFTQPPEKVGTIKGTLQGFCERADSVVREMGSYNLLASNCQHFCNNFLRKIDLATYPTTIGPETTLEGEDRELDTLASITRGILEHTPGIVGQIGARVVGSAVGAPSTTTQTPSSE